MDDLRDRRVLVTGAAGFVGANLTRELIHRGADVHAIVRPASQLWRIADIAPRLKLYAVDLVDRQELQKNVEQARPAFIFHLARHSGGHPSPASRPEALATNIVGTANLLETTASLDVVRLVHTGTWLEYGVSDRPLKESDLPMPLSFHGATKAAATLLCQQSAREHRRDVVVLRLFSVYGPWEAPTRLIPSAIRAALGNQEMALTAPGYRHDWIYVEDVVQACVRALQAESVGGEIINVGSGEQWSNEDVLDVVQAVCGREIRTRVGAYAARPWDRAHCLADIGKARQLLGWAPRHSLRKGIEKTVEWTSLGRRPPTEDEPLACRS